MTQADKEQDNGKEKEKDREKEKEKEQQRGVKRPIAPGTIPEPLQEVSPELGAYTLEDVKKTLRSRSPQLGMFIFS